MSSNNLLSRLSRADARLLEPHLEAVDLPLRKQLQARNKRVEQVYFMESGIASVVANGGQAIEVGMIGREGMSGVSVVLGDGERVPHETYMQIAGSGQRMSAAALREAIGASAYASSGPAALRTLVHDADHPDGAGQRTQQDRGTLARWLLMAA